MTKFTINKVQISFTDPEPASEKEAELYLNEAQQRAGNQQIKAVTIHREGDYADLDICFQPRSFERIRRITGYLTKTDSFNDAKLAELGDRVRHGEA